MKRKMKRFSTLVLLGVLIGTFATSCYVCYPTKKRIKQSAEYTEIRPLTADKFRKMIENDTSHYKIVIVTSPCCGPCLVEMRDVYLPMYNSLDTSKYKMYFIFDDCGGLPKYLDYFSSRGINESYFFRDDDPMFCDDYENQGYRMANIINYALQPKVAFGNLCYTPINILINKEGKVKQQLAVYNDVTFAIPYELRNMLYDSLTVDKLNYDKLDTICINELYPEDLKEYLTKDTVSFRTYKPAPPKKHFCTPDGKCY